MGINLKRVQRRWNWERLVTGCGTKCSFLATSAGSVAFPGFITIHETLIGIVTALFSVLSFQILCVLCQWWTYHHWILAAALQICIIRLSKLQEKEITALDFKGGKNPNICFNTYLSWLLGMTRTWISLKKNRANKAFGGMFDSWLMLRPLMKCHFRM